MNLFELPRIVLSNPKEFSGCIPSLDSSTYGVFDTQILDFCSELFCLPQLL